VTAQALAQLETDRDPRALPTYGVAEAARLLRIPAATLRSWTFGRRYSTSDGERFFDRLIQPPTDPHDRLSFLNLIEAHVLRSLRTRHGVSMSDVRKALEYAQQRYGIDRLLIRRELKAAPGRLFFDEYATLVELPRGGQLVLREVFEAHLERVVHDAHDQLPARFFPWFPIEGQEGKKAVVIDARIAFGSPVTTRRSVRTSVIADRFEAGEAVEELAQDYGLEHAEIEDAIRFERAA
jgi:uncharacterized protein (DUF433 family)